MLFGRIHVLKAKKEAFKINKNLELELSLPTSTISDIGTEFPLGWAEHSSFMVKKMPPSKTGPVYFKMNFQPAQK
jgi:hypothetical protein